MKNKLKIYRCIFAQYRFYNICLKNVFSHVLLGLRLCFSCSPITPSPPKMCPPETKYSKTKIVTNHSNAKDKSNWTLFRRPSCIISNSKCSKTRRNKIIKHVLQSTISFIINLIFFFFFMTCRKDYHVQYLMSTFTQIRRLKKKKKKIGPNNISMDMNNKELHWWWQGCKVRTFMISTLLIFLRTDISTLLDENMTHSIIWRWLATTKNKNDKITNKYILNRSSWSKEHS